MHSGGSPAASGAHAHRVIFIDLGRFLALIFMLYGHTVSALLAPEYQRGTWFDVWQFQRGLTSSLFLLLAGFAFSVATSRHWGSHQRFSPAFFRRVRRFSLFILLGYALHLPVSRLQLLTTLTAAQQRTFFAVDVLQLIGATFLIVQILVLATRSRRAFTAAALLLAVAILAVTHAVWASERVARLPVWLAAYLSPWYGSLFPLLPWASYVLFGAVMGQIYVGWGAARLTSYTVLALLLPGALMTAAASVLLSLEGAPWSADPWNFMPIQVTLRIGVCLVLLSFIAYASQRLARLPRVFSAVAQETLLIYFVHLCIVYGSIWNAGLLQAFGPTLGPFETLACVVLVLASMTALGWIWHWLKHARPHTARWATVGVAALLVARLL